MQTSLNTEIASGLDWEGQRRNVERLRAVDVSRYVRRMLADLGLTLSELNSVLASRADACPASRLPHTFFSTLRKGVSPHICQVIGLSNITNLLLKDWLFLFGYDVAEITRLQVKLHTEKTTLVTTSERLLPMAMPQRLCAGSAAIATPTRPSSRDCRFLFAKIGLNDGMAFPEIMPGSIVSVDTTRTAVPGPGMPRILYLVEHLRGLSCCYVNAVDKQEVLLTPHYLPYPCLRYRIGEQAVILGAIDSELRPLKDVPIPDPSRSSWAERHSPVRSSRLQNLSQLLRTSRERIGLRFREARTITELIAVELGNEEFAIALGSLSDYETTNSLPRHISKIMSLCIAYGIDLLDYLAAAGVAICEDDKTALPFPPGFAASVSRAFEASPRMPGRCWAESWYRLPTSLLMAFVDSLPEQSSLSWIECPGRHSINSGTRQLQIPELLLVDKNSTRLERATWPAVWQRPVYLVRHRSGKLSYGFCTVTDGLLFVHEDPSNISCVESFARYDVEVIGRVVAALRGVGAP